MSADDGHLILLRYNFRPGGNWDTQQFSSPFVPRVGDYVWVAALAKDLRVERVMIMPPNDGATKPRLVVHVDLVDRP